MRGLGRINRATYWLTVILVFAIGLIIGRIAPRESGFANLLLLLPAIPRLHDIGKSAWWAVAVLALEFAAGIALGMLLPPQQLMSIVMGIALVVAALLVVLGCLRGQSEANRFGPAPQPGLSYASPSAAA